jgi:3,4-dihydroxy 2-butanone 4-phosphate synthase / GTP cyclohydrolase II
MTNQSTNQDLHDDPFSPVEDIIADIKAGKLVVITDDADRENEGDLICAAELITQEMVNFMLENKGMLCAPVSAEIAQRLELRSMVENNREVFRTHFTVTVDARDGITTGVSAADRAKTIRQLANPRSTSEDFVQPGHISPLVAKDGGVLRRAGHTEAAVDLARMAGLRPAGALIEILNPDGTMARLPHLRKFCQANGLKLCSIERLINYRRRREKLVEKEEVVKMPTDYGDFDLHLYRVTLDGQHHVALVKGVISPDKPTLVRVHSECLTGDVFGSRRCDCGGQLHSAMQQISEEGSGILLYMRRHEGRGIGLLAKMHAYKLQEEGLDTVEANERLGFPNDLRDYGMGAQILYDLGVREIRLMTNNPKKVIGLDGHNLKIVEQVPIRQIPNEHNAKYLETKKNKMGHSL